MTLSPNEAESLARKMTELCEGAPYVLIFNDKQPSGRIENHFLSNLDDDEAIEFMEEMIEGLGGGS